MNTFLNAVIGIAVFGFVTSVTPGPNNTYLLSSGMNFGIRKSLTYINGIMLGLIAMFSAMYLGVGAIFRAYPVVQEVMKFAGFAYILYMAYKIVRSTFTHQHESIKPTGFWGATAFQMINPKAWIVVMSVVAAYIPADSSALNASIILLVFLVTTYPGAVIWAAFGQAMAGALEKPNLRRLFNISAAVLLVVSMLPVLFLE